MNCWWSRKMAVLKFWKCARTLQCCLIVVFFWWISMMNWFPSQILIDISRLPMGSHPNGHSGKYLVWGCDRTDAIEVSEGLYGRVRVLLLTALVLPVFVTLIVCCFSRTSSAFPLGGQFKEPVSLLFSSIPFTAATLVTRTGTVVDENMLRLQ